MTPETIQARNLYTLLQKLGDCRKLWEVAGMTYGELELARVYGNTEHAIDELLGKDLYGWHCAAGVPIDILLVLGSLIPSIDFEDACTICGLSAVRQFTPREAEHLLERAIIAHSRTVDPSKGEINDVIIDWIVERTKLNPRKLNGDRSHAAVLAWMSHCRSDRFLSEVSVRLGRVLAEGKGPYRSYFEGYLAQEQKFNDAGDYAKLAAQQAKKPQRSIGDYQQYRVGRLPDSHLQQLARRSVARQFLNDLWASSATRPRVDDPPTST